MEPLLKNVFEEFHGRKFHDHCDIQRDFELYEMIKDKVESISKKFTRPELWPIWMK